MGSKAQRKKEQHARKRVEKRKRQEKRKKRDQALSGPRIVVQPGEIPLASNARHRQRLAEQIPNAWQGELPEDVAVFDDNVLARLEPDVAQQVMAVRSALDDALASRGDDAVKRVSMISRGSPLSEWRLFLRGLIDWLAENTQAASDAWKRLNADRRPGRIATAMMLALRTDLETATPRQNEAPAAEPDASPWTDWDDQQLYHAKLLRRVRFDRAAIRAAEAGLRVPEEFDDTHLGPKKLQFLRRFVAEYEKTEPELVAALAQTARASLRSKILRYFRRCRSLVSWAAARSPKPDAHLFLLWQFRE